MTYTVLFSGGREGMVAPTVYGLTDPREPERIRYVGQTTNPGARYSTHLVHECTVRGNWVCALRRSKVTPSMVLLQVCDSRQEAKKMERNWIRHLQTIGQADLNDASRCTKKRRRAILARYIPAA